MKWKCGNDKVCAGIILVSLLLLPSLTCFYSFTDHDIRISLIEQLMTTHGRYKLSSYAVNQLFYTLFECGIFANGLALDYEVLAQVIMFCKIVPPPIMVIPPIVLPDIELIIVNYEWIVDFHLSESFYPEFVRFVDRTTNERFQLWKDLYPEFSSDELWELIYDAHKRAHDTILREKIWDKEGFKDTILKMYNKVLLERFKNTWVI